MEYFIYFFVFLIGLCFGSFLNAWIWRVHENMNIWGDRSICPVCHQHLAWYDNIPLVSYFLFLGGKCRKCHNKISWQYPLVEFITACLFVFIAWRHGFHVDFVLSPKLVYDLIVVFFLLFIFIYDFKYQEILDRSTLIPALLLFFISVSLGWHSWFDMALGIIIAGGLFLFQYLVSSGKWIGGGDVRLGVLMGIILGWQGAILALFISYIIGAVVGLLSLWLRKKDLKSEIPFGTFLTVGTFVVMFWGTRVIEWYMGLLR